MTHDVNDAYLSGPQAARVLGITGVGVAQLARQGKIPAVKIANRWLIPKAFVEEFARTYEGKRGRPRKNGPSAPWPEGMAVVRPAARVGPVVQPQDGAGRETHGRAGIGDVVVAGPKQTTTSAIPPGELQPGDLGVAARAGGCLSEDDRNGRVTCVEETPLADTAAAGVGAGRTTPEAAAGPEDIAVSVASGLADRQGESPVHPDGSGVALPADAGEESERDGGAFKVSAEVYHLDKNYDFELYEKGRINEKARLIVGRLKPRIPSLPQFSFRWDYRYEHLNVDIHGVEPGVVEWWTTGKNGYMGHLPRRLGGEGYAFEAVIWLPVTFVFRGRLTLVLGDSPDAAQDSPSAVAATTGGLKRLWSRWSGAGSG